MQFSEWLQNKDVMRHFESDAKNTYGFCTKGRTIGKEIQMCAKKSTLSQWWNV